MMNAHKSGVTKLKRKVSELTEMLHQLPQHSAGGVSLYEHVHTVLNQLICFVWCGPANLNNDLQSGGVNSQWDRQYKHPHSHHIVG